MIELKRERKLSIFLMMVLLSTLFMPIAYSLEYDAGTFSTVVFAPLQFREHKSYAGNPDITITKYATYTQMVSTVASVGVSNLFFVVNREWVHGKYLRWSWRHGGYGYGYTRIYDGEYNRSSMVDFPSGSGMLQKGGGLIQVLGSTNTGPITSDVLIDTSNGTQEKCTIFFHSSDGWTGQLLSDYFYWLEINAGSGGSGTFLKWNIATGGTTLTMEQTGTLNDYGRVHGGDIEDYAYYMKGYKENEPVLVNPASIDAYNDGIQLKERNFYSNYSNMFWVFAYFGHEHVEGKVTGHAYSVDGINWNIIEDSFQSLNVWHDAVSDYDYDFYFEPNGRYFWVSWLHTHSDPDTLYVARGEMHTDGSITFPEGRQLVRSTFEGKDMEGYMSIASNSYGYPFVAFTLNVGGDWFGYIESSSTNDGTWVSAGVDGFYSTDPKDAYAPQHHKVCRLLDGKMSWTMLVEDIGGTWFVDTIFYSGSAWLVNQQTRLFFDLATMGINAERRVDITSYGDITVGTYVYREAGFQKMRCEVVDYAGDWENSTVLRNYPELVGNWVPSITVNEDGTIFVFAFKSGDENYVNYTRRFSNYTWSDFWSTLYDEANKTYAHNRFHVHERFEDYITFWFHDGVQDDTDPADNEMYHDYLGAYIESSFEYYNTTLYNSDGTINDGWIFRGETYKFESFFMGGSTFELNFTDGEHEIVFTYNNATQLLSIITGDQFIVGDYFFNITQYIGDITKVEWGFIPNTNIVDIENTTVYYSLYNKLMDMTVTGSTGIEFNIYNLGGFTYYSFNGDGGKTPYGTSAFDLYATNGTENSYARAEQIFRKLQHISFLMEIDMSNEWDAGNGEFDIDAGVGYVDIGIDYRLNSTWVEGFKIRLYVQDANVGHHDLGIDHDWVEWSVDFWNYYPPYGDQQNLQSQLIYSNHWGYEHEDYVPDHHINRTTSQFFVDLWFDKTNASTTIACQVNSYYYGMKEQGSSFWFGYGTFIPMVSDYDNAKFIDDLYDEGGNITNCQKYDLIKFYMTVGKVSNADGDDETWRIKGIEDMHREQAIDRMEGIDEPTFVSTKVLDMPQTGFINAIKSALGNIANSITQGIFFTLKSLWAGVGWIAELMGLKEWYDALSMMLGNIATASLKFMDALETALINSALLLDQILRMISSGLTRYTATITDFITAILSWYTAIVQMFSGGGVWSINIWMSLSLGDWFGLLITLSPVLWINRLAKADDIIRTAQGDISFALMLITGLFNFLASIIMLSVALLSFIIGLLPI